MFATSQHAHFIGIGGIGMSGIAEILLNLGMKVSGSDLRRSPVTDRLAQLGATTQSALGNQTFSDNYGASVGTLGDALQTANTQVTNQKAVTQMLATQVSSVSGVSVDEEMTNLMSYQRAYEASAQLVTTLNTMMSDTLAMKNS